MRAALLALFIAFTAPAFAAPRLNFVYPAGAQRGTSVKVTFSGGDLKDVAGFYTTGTGLSAIVEPGGDATNRTVTLSVAPDAPLGIQQVRVYDGTGLSNPRYFRVGQWPEASEKEPNDALASAAKVTLPITLNGQIQQGTDRDGWTFHARPGETVVCEVEGLRVMGQVGDSWLKGYLEIQDKDGNTLAESQGAPDDYYRWDPLIAFSPPAEGDYTVFFRDLNWRGDAKAVYRLTLGVVPHAVGIFPIGGQRGTTVDVQFAGPNLPGDATQKVTLPADSTVDGLDVDCTRPMGTTNARPLHLSDLPDVPQTTTAPGNQTRETAQPVVVPCVVNGRLAKDGARDFYKFTVAKPQKLVLEVFSRRVGTPMDPEILLYDAKGNLLQADDDARGRDCRIERDFAPGDYTLAVRDVDNRGGDAFSYRLSVAPPAPRFRLIALPDAPKLARGQNVPLTVKIEREDGFDSEVAVSVEGLPTGVSAGALTIAKDKSEGQLTLSASADAATGVVRLSVAGTGKTGERALKAVARTQETYNIQGTAFQRDLLGPLLLVTEK